MSPIYRNNLVKGDRVIHAATHRPGTVETQPRESSRMVAVLWQGTVAAQYTDVVKLRLIVNGKPEDVPPCDGTPPDAVSRPAATCKPDTPDVAAVDVLKKERDSVEVRMRDLESQFKTLKTRREKLDQAIAVLSST